MMQLTKSLPSALVVFALPLCAIWIHGCGATNVDDLFASVPAARADGGAAGTGGNTSGGAAGTSGNTPGGAAGTGGNTPGGAAGAGGDTSGGAAGAGGDTSGGAAGAGGGSTCDPACTQRPGCPDPSCWKASANRNDQDAALAIDGKEATRYTTTAPGNVDDWIQVDLCEARSVTGINVFTASATDVAKSYDVQVSTDGNAWQTVLTSATAAQPRMALKFDPVTARHIRLNQTGKMGMWWSVNELSVVCQ
jgi:hypothetical protein